MRVPLGLSLTIPKPTKDQKVRKPAKRWCPACQKRDSAFKVDKSDRGPAWWAHDGCGCKTLPRKPMRKRKKGKRASLAREADRLWSLVIRKKGHCEVDGCPGRGVLQAAHGFSRRYGGTRWLPINGFALCQGCHVKFTHDPLAWDDRLRAAWGSLMYEAIKDRAQNDSRPDLSATVATLKAELEA